MAYNTTPHIGTGYSPYELVFGKLCYLPEDSLEKGRGSYNIADYANEFNQRLKQKARSHIEIAKQSRIEDNIIVNPLKLKEGDFALVKTANRKKNQAPYHVPYIIVG